MSTICAISTPYGVGGIAVVRVTGAEAISIVDSLFQGKQKLTEGQARRAYYGHIVRNGEVLDEVMVTLFLAPHSYTGEDMVEIACHGSVYIQRELLQWLIQAGATLAKAGEFTQRAFLNGKLDLTQAESVADIIASQSKAEKDIALAQLKGGVSQKLQQLRDQLLQFTSLIELELDFADHEDLEFADRNELQQLVQTIQTELETLIESFQVGNAIKNGIPVAIIGAVNAGKSTLLNALLGEQRALVSNIPGTTRDTIEECITIGDKLFRLIDTAGLRATEDQVEQMGIERTKESIQKAKIVIEVIDSTNPQRLSFTPEKTADKIWIYAYNKADLITQNTENQQDNFTVQISAKNNQIAPLLAILQNVFSDYDTSSVLISNTRHFEALSKALQALKQLQQNMANHLPEDLLAVDLHDCLDALGEITGEITSQEVLNNIFAKFCIGK